MDYDFGQAINVLIAAGLIAAIVVVAFILMHR